MKFNNYTSEDFLMDDSFIAYCRKTDPSAIKFWKNYLKENPGQAQQIAEAERMFVLLNVRRKDTGSALREFKQLFSSQSVIAESFDVSTTTPIRRLVKRLAVAAIVCLMGFGGYWLFNNLNKETPVTYAVYEAKIGKRLQVVLPDSSTVIVNSNSKLSVPNNYGNDKRLLLLEGEAFFVVRKDKSKPFIVKSGALATTALGTSFRVRAYRHETRQLVSLVTGKVKVEEFKSENQVKATQFLTPGQQAVLKTNEQVLTKQSFDLAELNKWKADELVLQNATFSEVVSKLEEWYGVKIEVNVQRKLQRHFTAKFERSSLDKVLDVFCFSAGCTYEIQKDKIIISY